MLVVKNLPAKAEDIRRGLNPWVRKTPWGRKWPPAPVFLPGKVPWTEEPGGLQSMRSQRVGNDWATNTSLQETQAGALCQLRGVEWEGRWEGGSKGRGYMYTYG